MYLSPQYVIGSVWISGTSKNDRNIIFKLFKIVGTFETLMNALDGLFRNKKNGQSHYTLTSMLVSLTFLKPWMPR